jgi:OmpA-OmpF porin, OOP family
MRSSNTAAETFADRTPARKRACRAGHCKAIGRRIDCRGRSWGLGVTTLLGVLLFALRAAAQPVAQGFALERYYPAPPGAAWLVMDDLKLDGKLGAGLTVTTGYANRPYSLALADGTSRLDVVSHQAFVDVGMAVFYDRYRLSLNLADPLYTAGTSGTAAGYQLTAPATDPGKYPDKVTDFRVGLDARLFGALQDSLRLGVSAQLWVPSGERSLYGTDGTLRAMFRALFAGEPGMLAYAGHLGVHVRPLAESPALGAPRGSELLFGVAAGSQFIVSRARAVRAVVGPEVWGATAFRNIFGQYTSSVEALLGARLERTEAGGAHTLVKIGFGEGIHAQLGAPAWRAVLAVELHDRIE